MRPRRRGGVHLHLLDHHEEIEGQFDWTGQRDLRHFVELCKEDGLYVYVRIGPWITARRNGDSLTAA